jgi:methionyl-tRNA formyltransferase
LSTVYLGTSEFAATILRRLAASEGHRPALVITRPDRPSGRGRRISSPPVADASRELGLELAQPPKVNDPEVLEVIARATGDSQAVLIVCAFGALITEPLLSCGEILNVHPSLLPRWRGAAPIERAIMNGDEQTGVCIMRLTAGLDSGPICLTGVEPINEQDTYGTLAERLQTLGGELLVRALDERPPFHEQPQDGVTYAEKIGPADRMLDPASSASQLARIVRALHPHIGARLQIAEDVAIGVLRARPAEEVPGIGPGELIDSEGRLLLGCGEGALELLEVQPPGGRAMDAGAYLRGYGVPGRR